MTRRRRRSGRIDSLRASAVGADFSPPGSCVRMERDLLALRYQAIEGVAVGSGPVSDTGPAATASA